MKVKVNYTTTYCAKKCVLYDEVGYISMTWIGHTLVSKLNIHLMKVSGPLKNILLH